MHYAITDFILEGIQNSLEAGADHIKLNIIQSPEEFKVTITDNGSGMSSEELEKCRDPYRTDRLKHNFRSVGLGLSFLDQSLAQIGGSWSIASDKKTGTELAFTGKSGTELKELKGQKSPIRGETDKSGTELAFTEKSGTELIFRFPIAHIDCPPIGDIPGTLRTCLCYTGKYNLIVKREFWIPSGKIEYTLERKELLEILGGVETVAQRRLLGEYLKSQEEEIDK